MKNIIRKSQNEGFGIETSPLIRSAPPGKKIKKSSDEIHQKISDIMQIDRGPTELNPDPIPSKKGGIPAVIIKKALEHYDPRTEEELHDVILDSAQEDKSDEEALDVFVDTVKKPYNLLYIDNNLSRRQLENRIKILSDLYTEYTSLDNAGRTKMEEMLNQIFEIPAIPDQIQSYFNRLETSPFTGKSQGAENTNLIFMNSNMSPQVIKRSKNRHSIDFASVLKLMYSMHALALHFNQEKSLGENSTAEVAFRDMTIYKEKDGTYVRMVRQNFAEGVLLKDVDANTKKNPEYRKAWHAFLAKVDAMRDTFGSIVDISDSTRRTKSRGNVANTGNVFVKFPTKNDPNYAFTIIDPDVFDTEPGEGKFFPSEHLRKNGAFGIRGAAGMAMTNFMRDTKRFKLGVRNWQEQFMRKEMGE